MRVARKLVPLLFTLGLLSGGLPAHGMDAVALDSDTAPKTDARRQLQTLRVGDKVDTTLQPGIVRYFCTTGEDSCVSYEVESTGTVLAFVADKPIQERAFAGAAVDVDVFTESNIAAGSKCVGRKCERSADFNRDTEWCLILANGDVPSLGFTAESPPKTLSITYKADDCSAASSVLTSLAIVHTVVGAIALLCFLL